MREPGPSAAAAAEGRLTLGDTHASDAFSFLPPGQPADGAGERLGDGPACVRALCRGRGGSCAAVAAHCLPGCRRGLACATWCCFKRRLHSCGARPQTSLLIPSPCCSAHH